MVAGSSPGRAGVGWDLVRAVSALADGDTSACSDLLAPVRAARGLGDREALTLAVLDAVLAVDAGDPRRAEARADLAARAHAAVPGAGDGVAAEDVRATLHLVRARSALRRGDLDRAVRALDTALTCPTASWSGPYRATCLAHAALVHAHTGAVRRAVEEAERAVADADPDGAATPAATIARLAGAHVAVVTGDPAAAADHLAEAGVPPDALWVVVRAVVRAALEHAAGSPEGASAVLDAAEDAAGRAGPWATDRVRQARTTWATASGAGRRQPRERYPVLPIPDGEGRILEPLTPRELDVLAAMSGWLTTEEIAEQLFISVNTVRTHVRNILTKLGVSRRNAAIREALRLGLITSDGSGCG
jgi:LuxR family maltose regulon positive regulatory protein